MMMDMDPFKVLNDGHGPAAGDIALQQAKTTGRNRVTVAGEADGAKPAVSAS
jgi:PleD family two-component response regulator